MFLNILAKNVDNIKKALHLLYLEARSAAKLLKSG